MVERLPGLQAWLAHRPDEETTKTWFDGTHRARSPAETLTRVAPHLEAFGITRVADIDGLDPLGVPVSMVTRPLSRSLAVAQGKGLTRAAARVSAIMEAIENHCAERILAPLRLASEDELRTAGRQGMLVATPIETDRLARSRERDYTTGSRILWIEGFDLLANRTRLVPYECVHTDFRLPRPDGHGFFPGDSNGLASGNTRAEALVHALAELIERDALQLWHYSGQLARARIDANSIADETVVGLLDTLAGHGVQVHLLDVTSDIGIACVQCLIEGDRAVDPELGSGCHPERNVAALRAITEAVQARVTFVAGSRDDFGREPYSASARRTREDCTSRWLEHVATLPVADFATLPSVHHADSASDLERLLQCLGAQGIAEVVAVDLGPPGLPVSVVRALAVGLEGADTPVARPGRRARGARRLLGLDTAEPEAVAFDSLPRSESESARRRPAGRR